MVQSFGSTDSLFGVQSEHFLNMRDKYFQEIDSIITQLLHDVLQRVGLTFLKIEFVPERKFLESWHCHGGRGSQNLEDSVQLFLHILAWEDGPKICHLSKNASYGPDVNGLGILLRTQQNIRGSIPQSNHFMSVAFGGNSRGSSKSEISNF